MILFIFLQISSHFPASNAQLHSTFCVCQNTYLVNCSSICGQYKVINFKSSTISNCLKDYDQELINFLVAGTMYNSSEMMPTFYLSDFTNISAIFYSVGSHTSPSNNKHGNKDNREHIILVNGTTGKNTNILFTNINIHLQSGKYKFNNLHLFNTDFTLHQTVGVDTSLHQHYLSGDYDSISRIPISISHYGPTKGAEIECDTNVNNIELLKNEKILFFGKKELTKECLLDLSQVGQKYNTTIILNSREINISFDTIPSSEFEIPKIIFKMQSNSKVFINSDQFENDKLLIDRIIFIHKSKTLYLYSKNGTIPPTFSYIGSGYRYLNDKKRSFYNAYCICPKLNCEEKCGKNAQIISGLDSVSLDKTVVGNPSESLTYYIANTKETEGNYPVFDLEHFGDRKLTLIGATYGEHVGFVGDATDDIGEFSFSKLTMHTKNGRDSLLFPNVSFHNVKIYQLQLSNQDFGKTEKQKSNNETEKQKSNNETEKQKSNNETEKQKSNNETEKQKSNTESDKEKSNTETEKQKSNNETEKQKSKNESDKEKSNNETEKQKSNTEHDKEKSNTEHDKEKSNTEHIKDQIKSHIERMKIDRSSIDLLLKKRYFLQCTYLAIDYPTLENFVTNEVTITAPQNGYDLHASNAEGDALSLRFFTSNQVEVNSLTNVSLMPHTTLTIHSNKNFNFFISPHFPQVVASFPKIRIIVEGKQTTVSFPADEQWPQKLDDISAKVAIVHNEATVYLNGHLDPQKNEFTTKPPIVDHRGSGPFYLNGQLSNFREEYCVCEGDECVMLCERNEGKINAIWPPIKFSEESIEKSAIGNPTSEIVYFVHGSSPDKRPLFGLHTFKSKSFSIVGCNDDESNNLRSSNKASENDDDEKITKSNKASENDDEKITKSNKVIENVTEKVHTKSSNNVIENIDDSPVFQYISLEGTNKPSEIVASSVSHRFKNVDILLTNAGIYFFNNVVFTNCRVRINESISLKPRGGYNRFFKIIQSGMTADMETLHSLNGYGSDYLTVPSPTYLTVTGGKKLNKIVIDDMYHLVLLDKEMKLDSKIDVSLLKRNPPKLITLNGKSENEPLFVEWKKNNEIKELNEVPHFIIDVSGLDSDDVFISFVGRKWIGDFANLSSRIKIKHNKINVHLISEKVGKKKFVKIRPPIVDLDGVGDLYIDGKKQLSRTAFINGNIILSNSDDYENENYDDREKMHYFMIIAVSIIIGFVVCFALFAVYKHKKIESYGKMGNTAFLVNHKIDNQLNELPIEPFQAVEEQSE